MIERKLGAVLDAPQRETGSDVGHPRHAGQGFQVDFAEPPQADRSPTDRLVIAHSLSSQPFTGLGNIAYSAQYAWNTESPEYGISVLTSELSRFLLCRHFSTNRPGMAAWLPSLRGWRVAHFQGPGWQCWRAHSSPAGGITREMDSSSCHLKDHSLRVRIRPEHLDVAAVLAQE